MHQKIVVSGFLYHKGKTLIIRRSKDERFLPHFYELPGGKVDFGESSQDALKREYLEEVNLKIDVDRPYRTFTYLLHGGKRHTVEIVFSVELNDDIKNIRLSADHTDYKWITQNEVDNYKISEDLKISIKKGFSFY